MLLDEAVETHDAGHGTGDGGGDLGDAVLTSARGPLGSCTDSSGVAKAADTTAAVPLTGSRLLPAPGVPTVSPSARSAEDTWSTSAALGPNSAAYSAEVR